MRKSLVPALWVVSVTALLTAADAPWTKAVSQWTEEDARQILTASPWVRDVRAGIVRRLGEDELRDAGQMGQQHGVGYDGVDPKNSGPKLPAATAHHVKGAVGERVPGSHGGVEGR